MSLAELKKVLTKGKVTIGSKETLRKLKMGEVKQVFLASNCSKQVKEDIEHFKSIADVKIIELAEPSDELMLVCKKNFPVAVVSC